MSVLSVLPSYHLSCLITGEEKPVTMSNETNEAETKQEEEEEARGRKKIELFGGGLTCSLPSSYKDLSLIRPVPDHQEVFVDQLTNASVTIEILAREDEVEDERAAKYFFDDLADFNQAESKSIMYHKPPTGLGDIMEGSDVSADKCFLIGRQKVPKDHQIDDVLMFLTAFRFKSISTEILITMSVGPDLNTRLPAELSDAVSAEPAVMTDSIGDEGTKNWAVQEQDYFEIIRSFRVVDWSLFG